MRRRKSHQWLGRGQEKASTRGHDSLLHKQTNKQSHVYALRCSTQIKQTKQKQTNNHAIRTSLFHARSWCRCPLVEQPTLDSDTRGATRVGAKQAAQLLTCRSENIARWSLRTGVVQPPTHAVGVVQPPTHAVGDDELPARVETFLLGCVGGKDEPCERINFCLVIRRVPHLCKCVSLLVVNHAWMLRCMSRRVHVTMPCNTPVVRTWRTAKIFANFMGW
jgi:hypothetical protein